MMHVGFDIGGTFTECVAVDRYGRRSSAKVLTTTDDGDRSHRASLACRCVA